MSAATDCGKRPRLSADRVIISRAATLSWLNRAGTASLRGLVAFGKFWYGFVIGDDWTVAAAVAAALAVTWLLHTAGVAAWWLPPLVAVAATGASLRRIKG